MEYWMSEEQAEYKAQTALQQKLAAMFAANKDEISIPKIYIDMTNDIEAAAVLDELLFWTLPKRGTGKTSLRVFKKGALWLAVRRKDWWDRKRLTERQADGAISKLIKLDLIEKDVFLFDGKPTVHIRMNMTVFVKLYGDKMREMAILEEDDNLINDLSDLYEMMGFPNEIVNSILPNGKMLNLPNGEFINSPLHPLNTTISNFSKTTKEDLAKTSVEATIFGGLEVSQETVDREKSERVATSAFEAAFGITRPWDWWNIKKEWRDLLKLVVDEFRTDSEVFRRYVAWYDDKGKFAGGMNATQIKRDPDLFSTAWDMFKRQDKPASVPQYKPLPEDNNIYVPNPNRRTS
jgi:hypothetical protein